MKSCEVKLQYNREYHKKNKKQIAERHKLNNQPKQKDNKIFFNFRGFLRCIIREERIKENNDRFKTNNPDYVKSYMKKYNDNRKGEHKIYSIKNRERLNENVRRYAKNNRPKILQHELKLLNKLGIVLKLPGRAYQFALNTWAKLIRELNPLCWCGEKATHSHHIFEKALYPKLSLNPNNGIALCLAHHYEVHGKKLKKW